MSAFLSFLIGTAFFVLVAILLARVAFAWALRGKVREPDEAQRAAMREQNRQVRPVTNDRPPPAPLLLCEGRDKAWTGIEWALGLLVVAAALFDDPTLLWSAWLAYPVATITLLVAVGIGFVAWGVWRERLRADASGLARVQGETVMSQLRWSDLGSAVLVENRTSAAVSGPRVSRIERSLMLLDRQGRELMKMDWPLKPLDQGDHLLDAIPSWSGVDVILERRVNGQVPQ